MTRRSWLLLGALLVLQAVLVLGTFVSAPHPGGDNAGYVALADALRDGQGYTEVWDPQAPPHTKYPPVFAGLLAVALTLGVTGWAGLKLVPALFALVTVAGVFLWLRRREGEWVAAVLALLTGASAALIYHAHWLLSDVPFLAFTVLALAALDRAMGDGTSEPAPAWSTVLAAALVSAAFLTRTAGLPLLAAAVLAPALSRRWRQAGLMTVLLALPAGWWVLRGRAADTGQGRYGSEFFLRDPYDPDLGRADVGDFVARLMDNLGGYLGRHLPDALFGSSGGWVTALSTVVVVAALVGWVGSLRARRIGAAAIFLPLYAGLILLWPQVWSGDRFALPLVPVLLLFAWRGIQSAGGRIRASGDSAFPVLLPALVLAGAVAAGEGAGWLSARGEAAACRGAAEAVGPWACGGGGLLDLVVAARWAGEALPAGSAVMTRKPRIWYAMSGVPTRTYPFTREPGVLLAEAETAGAEYVLLDFVGNQGVEFVGAALAATPDRFCQVGAFGGGGGMPAARLLRILPPGQPSGTRVDDGQLALAACPTPPTGVVVGREGEMTALAWRIPVLEQRPSADTGETASDGENGDAPTGN